MIEFQIIEKIQDWAKCNIFKQKSVAGGSIARSNIVKLEDGRTCFLKTSSFSPDTFFKEANGLHEIRKANCIKVPEVLIVDETFLLLEYIEEGRKDQKFFVRFGEQLADLHTFTNVKFGFKEDNYIGSTVQLNVLLKSESESWLDFYYNKRLLFQYKLAEKNKLAGNDLKNAFILLENKIEKILEGSEEKPCLLHGDLWGGNYLCDLDSNPVLIDPAVYYGHRETDLAMTKLFGGFANEFYHSYQRQKPLPQGYNYRENIYLLYHVLNHLNLFGNSYYDQAVRLAWYYLH